MAEFTSIVSSTPKQFRQILGKFATGVSIITCLDQRQETPEPVGVTINSFTSVSLEPALILFCLSHKAHSYDAFKQADSFMIHLLDHESQELSNLFATPSADKWSAQAWQLSTLKSPLLKHDMIAHIECIPHKTVLAGDHDIFIAEVKYIKTLQEQKQPLLYFSGNYGKLA